MSAYIDGFIEKPINPNNKSNGLIQLKRLLKLIIRKWPEVEFMDSGSLGNLILNTHAS